MLSPNFFISLHLQQHTFNIIFLQVDLFIFEIQYQLVLIQQLQQGKVNNRQNQKNLLQLHNKNKRIKQKSKQSIMQRQQNNRKINPFQNIRVQVLKQPTQQTKIQSGNIEDKINNEDYAYVSKNQISFKICTFYEKSDKSQQRKQETKNIITDQINQVKNVSKSDSSINEQNEQTIQIVTRTIPQLQCLANHISKQYGGYVIPIIDVKAISSANTILTRGFDFILQEIQTYLRELIQDMHCCTDHKLYCFILEQAFTMHVHKYKEALTAASQISKKYLNTIFTRKQYPQQPPTTALIYKYDKLLQSIKQFDQISQFASQLLNQHKLIQQIGLICSEMGGHTTLSVQPLCLYEIEVKKIQRIGQRYQARVEDAFFRWQILIQAVKESRNSLYKGVHEDEQKYRQRSQQFNKWTRTLADQFMSMRSCFIHFTEIMCKFINKIRAVEVQYANISKYAQNKEVTTNPLKVQQQEQSVQAQSQKVDENLKEEYKNVEFSQKLRQMNYLSLQITKTQTTIDEQEQQQINSQFPQ